LLASSSQFHATRIPGTDGRYQKRFYHRKDLVPYIPVLKFLRMLKAEARCLIFVAPRLLETIVAPPFRSPGPA
jgi:hypothetical protein